MRKREFTRFGKLITQLEDDGWKLGEYLLNNVLVFSNKDNSICLVAVKTLSRARIAPVQKKMLLMFSKAGIVTYTWHHETGLVSAVFDGKEIKKTEEMVKEEEVAVVRNKTSKNLIHLFAVKWFDQYGIPLHIKLYYYKNMLNLLSIYKEEDIISGMNAFFDTIDKFILESKHSMGLFLSAVDNNIAISREPKEGRGRTA